MAGPSTYQQTTGNQQTNSSTPVPIPGLVIKLSPGVGESASIILNVPNPYAQGNNFPGGWFGISVNGTVHPVYASFTYGVQQPTSFNRMPTTLVIGIPLDGGTTVQAMWAGIRGSTVLLDSPATLTVFTN
jgi:hypothetical protein